MISYWLGQGRAAGPRTTRYPGDGGVFGRSQQLLAGWRSGRFMGSVVPWGAADSLLHCGEVLSLAEFSAHTRHIGVAEVNTEILQRGDRRE